jgi:hypothetical protein
VSLDDVFPRRRVRVLEVGHEDLRPGVERVDHHLAVDRPRDLAPPVDEIGRRRRDVPVARMADERRVVAGVETRLARAALGEQLESQRPEIAVQLLDELQLSGYPWNCASSVEPLSASVEASGETACVTRSK